MQKTKNVLRCRKGGISPLRFKERTKNISKITEISYYQTPGVEDSGKVHDYLNRGKGDSSVVIDTDPGQFAYTQVDKKSWINHFPHYDNDWDNYENNGNWRKEFIKEDTDVLSEFCQLFLANN